MLALYYSKEKRILKIEKNANLIYGENHLKDIKEYGVAYFNSNYYIAEERKPLVEKAQSLRNCWIDELKKQLIELEDMNYPKR
jgi:hypothetical protein